MKFITQKKGFTLVEILVVIAIIAALSTLAVNGYLQYRKSALLDLTADNLISQIYAMKSKTVYRPDNAKKFAELKSELEGGLVDGGDDSAGADLEGLPQCYGLYFQRVGDGMSVKTFSQNFDSKQEWNEVSGWVYKGCGGFDPNNPESVQSIRDFELDKQVKVSDVTDSSGVSIDSFVLRFLPPDGGMQVRRNIGNFEADFSENTPFNAVNFHIQFSSDIESEKRVNFNLINGNAIYQKN